MAADCGRLRLTTPPFASMALARAHLAIAQEAARRRLLSFVACEALEPHWRMGALGLADTCARLEHGLRGLQARQTTLATEVALRRAVGTTDDE